MNNIQWYTDDSPLKYAQKTLYEDLQDFDERFALRLAEVCPYEAFRRNYRHWHNERWCQEFDSVGELLRAFEAEKSVGPVDGLTVVDFLLPNDYQDPLGRWTQAITLLGVACL